MTTSARRDRRSSASPDGAPIANSLGRRRGGWRSTIGFSLSTGVGMVGLIRQVPTLVTPSLPTTLQL